MRRKHRQTWHAHTHTKTHICEIRTDTRTLILMYADAHMHSEHIQTPRHTETSEMAFYSDNSIVYQLHSTPTLFQLCWLSKCCCSTARRRQVPNNAPPPYVTVVIMSWFLSTLPPSLPNKPCDGWFIEYGLVRYSTAVLGLCCVTKKIKSVSYEKVWRNNRWSFKPATTNSTSPFLAYMHVPPSIVS